MHLSNRYLFRPMGFFHSKQSCQIFFYNFKKKTPIGEFQMENLEEEKIEVNGERFEPLEHLVFSKYLKLDLIFPSTPSKTLKNYKIFEPNWFRQDHGKKPVQLHPEAEKRYMKNDNFTLQYFVNFVF